MTELGDRVPSYQLEPGLIRLFLIYMDWRILIWIERYFDLLRIETHSIHMIGVRPNSYPCTISMLGDSGNRPQFGDFHADEMNIITTISSTYLGKVLSNCSNRYTHFN